jgi:hypothetical protein
MKRVALFLTEVQIAALRKAAKRTGLKMAELVRRYIDEGRATQRHWDVIQLEATRESSKAVFRCLATVAGKRWALLAHEPSRIRGTPGKPGIVGHSEVIVEPALRGDKLPTPGKFYKGESQEKILRHGRMFSCFPARLIEQRCF